MKIGRSRLQAEAAHPLEKGRRTDRDHAGHKPLMRGRVVLQAALPSPGQRQRVGLPQRLARRVVGAPGIEHLGQAEVQGGAAIRMEVGVGQELTHGGQVLVGQLGARNVASAAWAPARRGSYRSAVRQQRSASGKSPSSSRTVPRAQWARGQVRLVPQGLAVVSLRLRKLPLFVPHAAQAAVGLCVRRVELQGPAVDGQGLVVLLPLGQEAGEVGMEACRPGFELDCPLIPGDRVVQGILFLEGLAHVVVGHGQGRVDPQRLGVGLPGLGEPPGLAQRVAEVVAGLGQVGAQPDGGLEVGQRLVRLVPFQQ